MSSPGPVLVLRRNEPVEVTVVNQLGESTAIHWHGMELDSIYDGVHGWSGVNQNLAPLIPPRRLVRRSIHAAPDRHVHVPHAPAR